MDFDEFNKMMEWFADNTEQLDIVEQATIMMAFGEFRNKLKPIYENYTQPKKFFFKYD